MSEGDRDLLHLTMNTGEVRLSTRSEVVNDVLAMLQPMLTPGLHTLPMHGGYSLEVPIVPEGWWGTLYQAGQIPIATIVVAAHTEEGAAMWLRLRRYYQELRHYLRLERCPEVPERAPWAAVISMTPTSVEWLGELERSLAWAYITRRRP